MFDVRIFSLKTNILLCKVFTTHLWSAVKTQIHIPSKRYMAIQSTLHPKRKKNRCMYILPIEKKWNVRENIGNSCKIAGKGQHWFFWKRQWIDCCCVKMIIVFSILWWFFFVCGLSIMRPLCCKFHIFFGLLLRERELCRNVSRACFQKIFGYFAELLEIFGKIKKYHDGPERNPDSFKGTVTEKCLSKRWILGTFNSKKPIKISLEKKELHSISHVEGILSPGV